MCEGVGGGLAASVILGSGRTTQIGSELGQNKKISRVAPYNPDRRVQIGTDCQFVGHFLLFHGS
jgi:hypothetical protein